MMPETAAQPEPNPQGDNEPSSPESSISPDEEQRASPEPEERLLLIPEDYAPPTPDLTSLANMQAAASGEEIRKWLARGATKNNDTNVWRSADGRFVAPQNFLLTLIRQVHGNDHVAKGEVIRRIQKEWWSPYLGPMVHRTLSQFCDICARFNVRKHFTSPIGHIPEPDGPFRHIMFDYVDMGEPRIQGKRYILVVEDRFSRWVEAVATAKEDATAVAKFLCREVIPRFGIPDTISSDNGKHFTNKIVQKITQWLKIKHRFGCVYHPQSQGMVERANGVLKMKLAKICAETGMNWFQALPLALMGMRSQTNRNTHLTPHEMLTGRPMLTSFTRGPYKGPTLEQLQSELDHYVKHLSEIHKAIFQQVKGATIHDNTRQRAADQAEDAEAEDERTVLPGDWVFIRVFKRKWDQARREGPYKVVLATPTAVKVKEWNRYLTQGG
ncbi:uncharacterized protein K02A2.6-like [Clarias gariepinus]|uniref:uncharacterized protein K02A2.6-like n=1 Tax=Clarias gariepinus TaxID=13013 RepID=UPI00234C4E12|nr:uncharacterized protein K02A2.6-like [Clarias gariepinus]